MNHIVIDNPFLSFFLSFLFFVIIRFPRHYSQCRMTSSLERTMTICNIEYNIIITYNINNPFHMEGVNSKLFILSCSLSWERHKLYNINIKKMIMSWSDKNIYTMRKCGNTQCNVTTPYYIQYYVQNLYITRAKQAYK